MEAKMQTHTDLGTNHGMNDAGTELGLILAVEFIVNPYWTWNQ